MRDAEAKPPEWWTAENTEAWAVEVWGNPEGRSEAQQGWADRIKVASGKAGAACYRPLTTKELVEMRANDPRPANTHYSDGTPILSYKPLTVKRAKKR
jgi:hypothetical protein